MKTRIVETGVEMRAGQTLAIAGLVQNTVESQNSGLPWISEVPYLGVPFRNVSQQMNEVELLITVTPELVEALDANQVPPCGPGMETAAPSDWELFFKGHLEVPVCCYNGGNAGGGYGQGGCSDPGPAARGAVPPPDIGAVPPAPLPPAAAVDGSPNNRYAPPNPNNSNRADASGGRIRNRPLLALSVTT